MNGSNGKVYSQPTNVVELEGMGARQNDDNDLVRLGKKPVLKVFALLLYRLARNTFFNFAGSVTLVSCPCWASAVQSSSPGKLF